MKNAKIEFMAYKKQKNKLIIIVLSKNTGFYKRKKPPKRLLSGKNYAAIAKLFISLVV